MKKYGLVPLLLLLMCPAFAQQKSGKKKTPTKQEVQQKKPLSHDVYDSWNDITERKITDNGQYFVYGQNPQEGDGATIIHDFNSGQKKTYPRGTGINLTADSKYAIFKIKPHHQLVKDQRRQKKKKEELPKDSLGIVDLATGGITKFPAVKSYKVPEKSGASIAFLTESAAVKTDSTAKPNKKGKKENEENGFRFTVRDLQNSAEQTFEFVKEYTFSQNGQWLAFTSTGNDSTLKAGVYILESGKTQPILVFEGHPKHKFTNLSFAETNTQLAWIADLDTNTKTQIRLPKLYYWKEGMNKADLIADETNQPGPADWFVNAHYKPVFSKDGNKLFFGTNPKVIVPDTTLLPDEIVNVEVWHWKDPLLQTQQKVHLERDRKKSYLAVYHIQNKKMVQLGDKTWDAIELVNQGNADFVLAKSTIKYSHEHWDWNPKQDVALISLIDGSQRLVSEKLEGSARISPQGKYVYWFSNPDTAWFAYHTQTLKLHQLTDNKSVRFADETDDHPDYPRAYGIAGWTANDESIVINDRYDLWEFIPGNDKGKKLTNGREHQRTYRYVSLDSEARHINLNDQTILQIFNENSKQSGFYRLSPNDNKPVKLMEGDFKTGAFVLKAKNADKLLFTKESFRDFPDWYVSDTQLKSVTRITEANPQQAEYSWGNVELISWVAGDGTPLQGLLYKPENFDPSKKYPMMVYYYEKNSDNLHSHFAPKPIRSYVNFSYFASNGYLIFVPDIVYEIGHPGKSAYNCLIPGVLNLISKGFVNEERIGISGHSWGGYQTAYLITKTNIFRAAEAGAPVSNMTSAYGGIRWDTGLNRQAQYERNQSRIGGTLWEKPMEYIENSPLFYAPKVETPLLMMHNDEDGAVPWYQGIEFYLALKRLNKPVWMLNYNGEKHGLGQRQNMKDFTVRLYQFFDHYLKDIPAPEWLTDGLPMIEKGINQKLEPATK